MTGAFRYILEINRRFSFCIVIARRAIAWPDVAIRFSITIQIPIYRAEMVEKKRALLDAVRNVLSAGIARQIPICRFIE